MSAHAHVEELQANAEQLRHPLDEQVLRAPFDGRKVTAEGVADAFVYLATAPSTTGS